MSRPYTIARLAEAAGVHVETIRYYQRLRLVPEPPRPLGGIRRYTEADAERLRFIKRAQAMGFTLAEIVSLLDLQRRRRSCHATRELAAAKLGLVDARIRELRDLRKELASLIADCDANAEDNACPVIQRLAQQPREAAGRRQNTPAS
jgi:MerR family transcriptional regulator, mercuric resistance operon regulatory protein